MYCSKISLKLQPGYTVRGRLCKLGRIKRRQAEVPFPARAKPHARRAHHAGLIKKFSEKRPGIQPFRRFKPNIRRVHAAERRQPRLFQGVQNHAGVLLVTGNHFPNLGLALRLKHRFRRALDDIRHAVKLGGLAAQPQRV